MSATILNIYHEELFFMQTGQGNTAIKRSGSPGLGVMGGDSCSKGFGFEYQLRILNGYFLHLFFVKIVML